MGSAEDNLSGVTTDKRGNLGKNTSIGTDVTRPFETAYYQEKEGDDMDRQHVTAESKVPPPAVPLCRPKRSPSTVEGDHPYSHIGRDLYHLRDYTIHSEMTLSSPPITGPEHWRPRWSRTLNNPGFLSCFSSFFPRNESTKPIE
ncbi:hypothetical protein PIB30_031947 [Stylosanthes scabra]|uniref:Uncharacterized protein n=1 Tax=Stylosanthes scabra TaxID=79078 RepID=A0ABU6RC65_9FABA|nr:hypothetical protein [Stylosanthes scabra]